MTAQEKFEARLEELGLTVAYETTGDKVGKVMDDGTIVILVHYPWEPGDPYTERRFPSFDELRKDEQFVKECMDNFFENDDDKFVADLARWLQYGSECRYPCPLYAEDVYFAANGLELSVFNYEDDPEPPQTAEEIIKNLVAEHSLV